MKINEYYQSGRYSKNAIEWREQCYFPMRIKWILDKTSIKFRGKVLDAGCGDGAMLLELKKINPGIEIYGTDISEKALRFAQEKGIKTKISDLNFQIPFDNNFFNFVIAHELIEHLVDPDNFLEECGRVLEKEGYLIITTPNLVSWYHRPLFLFGFHPLFSELSTRNRKVGTGFLKKIIKNEQPVGHIRIFTVRALKDLLQLYGFEIVKVKGSPIPFNFPKIVSWLYDTFDFLFSFIPSLSSNLLIIAKKK